MNMVMVNKILFDLPLALWKVNLQYANSHSTSIIKVKHKIHVCSHSSLALQNAQSGKKRDVEGADLAENLEPSRKSKRLDHEDYSPPD